MLDETALRAAWQEHTRVQLADDRFDAVLHRLIDQARHVLHVDNAGAVVVDSESALGIAIAQPDPLERLEENFLTGEPAPCTEATVRGRPVEVEDLSRTADRWPEYRRITRAHGYEAVLAVPLDVHGATTAALAVYRPRKHRWSDDEVRAAEQLADLASSRLRDLHALTRTRRLAEQLQEALDSRVVIEQAKGVLAERRGVDVSTAFALLRSEARNTNRTLHDLAHEVVSGHRAP
jgi:GAF domain-containing protein